jgi:hypothetical protein
MSDEGIKRKERMQNVNVKMWQGRSDGYGVKNGRDKADSRI